MAGRLILPPTFVEVSGPLVFFAGPIQGAPDWQSVARDLIWEFDPDLHIASPRRKYIDDSFDFDVQLAWETHYLRRAAREGVILFWLANEAHHSCDRAYAQTTRGELSEWRVRHEYDPSIRIVVGIEEGFTGARWARQKLAEDQLDIPVFDSLEAVCRKAGELASMRRKTA